jgi:valyl-tRNA synthetase
MDMMARYKRMRGFNVLFPVGLDKNGLPIEVQTEREFGIRLHDTPREEFIGQCRLLLAKYGDVSLDSFRKLGISFNSWDVEYKLGGRYDTDDDEYRRLTQETFIRLWRKGLIYKGTNTTNYCPVCGTAISDAEIDYDERSVALNYIAFRVKETGETITIATTRPELLCTCKLVLFNPSDTRYGHLDGKHAVVPAYEHEVPILPHPYAKPEFGTGLVMICSYGDSGDIRLLRELGVEPTYAIDPAGKMNELAGKYQGLPVPEARRKTVEDLQQQGLISKVEKVIHQQPICERSKDPIEFIAMDELYLKQVGFKEELLRIGGRMRFHAKASKQILDNWIESITIDWVLSRRRYYGTEVPIWYCVGCGAPYVPEPGRYYRPWKEKCPAKACGKCGGSEFRGDDRIFDTWFDSSSSELYILGYLWDRKRFRGLFPCSMRPQGKEIVRNWLYFTLLKSYHMFHSKPFENVWIHMHVVDERGEKMSKSRGNAVDPQEVIAKYGAEAFRIWSCLEGDITGGDIRYSSNRLETSSRFLTKLWNLARLISNFPIPKKAVLTETDRWILAELTKLVSESRKGYDAYSFFRVATLIRDFVWNVFAPHYVEMVKVRAYNPRGGEGARAAWFTLHVVIRTILLLLSPITPYITDHLWRQLYGEGRSIHARRFPMGIIGGRRALLIKTERLIEFNSAVWNTKKSRGLSLRDGIGMAVPSELACFSGDLIAMHHLSPPS